MNEKELRELDAWIAEHVMGWKWMQFDAHAVAANSKKKRDQWCQLVPPFEAWYKQPELRGVECKGPIKGLPDWTDLSTFLPTTDPAASMQVLEKCLLSSVVEISPKFHPEGYAIKDANFGIRIKAPTLELAIALFSKKLFTAA